MNAAGLTLLVPEKADEERDAIAAAWELAGGAVLRLGRFWDPPQLAAHAVRVYGHDTFCLVLQQKLGLTLTSPADDLLFAVPESLLGRKLTRCRRTGLADLSFPVFVKSLVPKRIRSRIYESSDEVLRESAGLDEDAEFLASEVLALTAEARAFVLEGQVLDAAAYEGTPDLGEARTFLAKSLPALDLPRAVVIDLARLAGGTWALLEFNAAWGAGLNGCKPDLVLPAIEAASRPEAPRD